MITKRKKARVSNFKPDRQFVQNAVNEYLAKGGKIEKVEIDDTDYIKFVNMRNRSESNDFLRGN